MIPLVFAQETNFLKNIWDKITGKAVSEQGFKDGSEEKMTGPSSGEIDCMKKCVSIRCLADDMECMKLNSEKCGKGCGVETSRPEPKNQGEECMQKCVSVDCEEFNFECERKNKAKCEDECNMKRDAPDESEMDKEQKCITECVAKVDSNIRCGNSKEGETGNSVCQKCADDCVIYYEGPCLNDEQIREKEKECQTCEHCYGESIMGASGEGWDCIVDVECKDASSEFGDEPGEGPGIGQEGFIAKVEGTIGNTISNVVGFFKEMFSFGNKDNQETQAETENIEQKTSVENTEN